MLDNFNCRCLTGSIKIADLKKEEESTKKMVKELCDTIARASYQKFIRSKRKEFIKNPSHLLQMIILQQEYNALYECWHEDHCDDFGFQKNYEGKYE